MSDVTKEIKFWVEDPAILLTDLVFFPTENMSKAQKLNALTRLALVISLGLYATENQYWSIFLTSSIILIIIINYSKGCSEPELAHTEGFSMVPTRIDDDFAQTIVAPTYAEEHQSPPPSYDLYENLELLQAPFEEPIRPQAYPYGQYLTKTNLLPSDEYIVHNLPSGGSQSAREYVNSAFLRHDLAYKENLTRIYKKQLARRFRMNTYEDTLSPFSSF